MSIDWLLSYLYFGYMFVQIYQQRVCGIQMTNLGENINWKIQKIGIKPPLPPPQSLIADHSIKASYFELINI